MNASHLQKQKQNKTKPTTIIALAISISNKISCKCCLNKKHKKQNKNKQKQNKKYRKQNKTTTAKLIFHNQRWDMSHINFDITLYAFYKLTNEGLSTKSYTCQHLSRYKCIH